MERSNVLLFGTFPNYVENEKNGVKISIDGTYNYTNISAGDQHIVVITSVGSSFAFGSNKDLQLGVGEKVESIDKFVPVITQESVVSVKCGKTFTIWQTSTGKQLIAGKKRFATPKKNNENFELFDVCFDSICAVVKENQFRFYKNYSENENYVDITLPAPPQEVACSSECAYALTEGSVFRLNSSGDLTCALSYVQNIIKIKSTCSYLLAMDKNGTLWMSGDMPNMKRKIDEGPMVTKAISFYALPKQIFFQNDKFKLFALGNNENGQLADGTNKRRVKATPTVIEEVGTSVAGNGNFTAIIESPFSESLIAIDYNKLTPSDLSTPLEDAEDMFTYK